MPRKFLVIVALSMCCVWPSFAQDAPPLRPAQPGPEAEDPSADHPSLIRAWNADSLKRGEKLYATLCITCHGTPEKEGTLPTSRPFWKEPFKNGSDPYSLYKTIGNGLGQMPAWPWLSAELRYDVIHYVREALVKPHNPAAYFPITPAYLNGLPRGTGARAQKSAEQLEFEKGPKYLRMNFGPALHWTYQAASNNIAYKGVAVRLDDGPGGVSKGHAWMLYDHDTLRVAAAWTGDSFVDWKGIAFDGSHQTHTSIKGDIAFVNPVGPAWAHPQTGSFDDPRLRGRDGKCYGPLPRDWVHFRGTYHYGAQVVLAYTVGEAEVLELAGAEGRGRDLAFSRTLNVGKSSRDLTLRLCPADAPAVLVGESLAQITNQAGFQELRIPASATPLRVKVLLGRSAATPDTVGLFARAVVSAPAADLRPLTHGGPARWQETLSLSGQAGTNTGAFVVDAIPHPSENPWNSWMRFGGFDFFPDGQRAAVCTWMGDVWLVEGLDRELHHVTWKRIASGLFQPLGVKIVDGTIYVTCRDQIARLHDLNGDGEIDFYENFNNDHQVTEHFHEFAMGLQTDAQGNFYYAKSARHALPAVVPHHGTLLRVSPDGLRTEIVASGFRAANGVCVNEDGTFFVTDQEGHWTPKNRINWVKPGGFYGNMFGYTDRTSIADEDMEQPLVWITNEMDRSPGEVVRVPGDCWGPFRNSLLNLSYGTGRIFLIPHETVRGQMQGGVVRLPIPELPTGVMRGRFHPRDGQLYACGLFAWAGNQTQDGGFYRVRYTGAPAYLPLELHAQARGIRLTFSDPLDGSWAQNPTNYTVKIWSLKRTANYGSKHYAERTLPVENVTLSADGKTVQLEIPSLQPTWCMEIKCDLRGQNGVSFTRIVHNTIHVLGE